MKNGKHILPVILNLALLLFISCGGSGSKSSAEGHDVISKEIPIGVYNELKVEGAIDIFYESKPDEAAYMRVEAEDDIIPLLDAKVKKQTLNIKAWESINPSRFTIYTNSPNLKYVEGKGASVIHLKGTIQGDKFKMEQKGIGNISADDLVFDKAEFYLRGSGDLEIAGQVESAKMEITGNGNIRAFDLGTNELECRLNGNGDMDVSVEDKLSIEIKGNGHLVYKGDPQITKQKIKGTGTVKMK